MRISFLLVKEFGLISTRVMLGEAKVKFYSLIISNSSSLTNVTNFHIHIPFLSN
jgi:hypothetical protein